MGLGDKTGSRGARQEGDTKNTKPTFPKTKSQRRDREHWGVYTYWGIILVAQKSGPMNLSSGRFFNLILIWCVLFDHGEDALAYEEFVGEGDDGLALCTFADFEFVAFAEFAVSVAEFF